MKLGKRLHSIASLAAHRGPMADIGTDHAYLPIYLVQQGCIPRAIAVEVNEGPFNAAKEMINAFGLTDKIDLRFGNGLEPLRPGEASTIAIAGMGGSTMIDILTDRPEVTSSAKLIVLQPMTASAALRRWLVGNSWRIIDEDLVLDEGRLYEIIAAEQGASETIEDILFEIGPILWSKRPEHLLLHIEQLIVSMQRVLEEMNRSAKAVQTHKYQELKDRIQTLEEKRKCLLGAI